MNHGHDWLVELGRIPNGTEMKPQSVRLLDVFAIGPLMVWGGVQTSRRSPVLGATLAVMGVLTVVYNGQNYLKARR